MSKKIPNSSFANFRPSYVKVFTPSNLHAYPLSLSSSIDCEGFEGPKADYTECMCFSILSDASDKTKRPYLFDETSVPFERNVRILFFSNNIAVYDNMQEKWRLSSQSVTRDKLGLVDLGERCYLVKYYLNFSKWNYIVRFGCKLIQKSQKY